MILICSYCRKYLGVKEPYDNENHTHGMCSDCYERVMRQLNGLSYDEFLEEFAAPVMIVDTQGRIAAANSDALEMFGKPVERVHGFLGGEAMECAYAKLAEGCGKTEHCPACTIRRLVENTFEKKEMQREVTVSLKTEHGRLLMTVLADCCGDMVRLVIDSKQTTG